MLDQSQSTGGNFSCGYEVSHPQHGDAFMKALDYSGAMRFKDAAFVLRQLTNSYLYERDLLEECGAARLTKVVMPLTHGQIDVPGHTIIVNYLIFEQAEGDVRKHLAAADAFDLAWALRVLHNIAVGISQLHRRNIVHQDVKPSNVLTFEDGKTSKLADLGRAEQKGNEGPWFSYDISGDPAYAPIEHLYGHVPPDWNQRRRACDLYHLGSMIHFLFADTGTTPAIEAHLLTAQRPDRWNDTYAAVLPFVRSAFDTVAADLEARLPDGIAAELTLAFRELCDPEPDKRGHPAARKAKHADSYRGALRLQIQPPRPQGGGAAHGAHQFTARSPEGDRDVIPRWRDPLEARRGGAGPAPPRRQPDF